MFKRSLFLLLLTGCSSVPSSVSRTAQFKDLDLDARKTFVALYPEMSPEERENFIGDPNLNDDQKKKFEKTLASPQSRLIASLEIKIGEVSKEGIPLRAILHYGDGRNVDASSDVQWDAHPALAWVKDSVLKFDCVHSDVEVTADFYGEAVGKKNFPFRKEIERLELSVDDSSMSIQKTDLIAFKLKADCKDGTDAIVTCQAQWSSADSNISLSGCGIMQIKDFDLDHPRATVSASYGKKSISQTVNLKK